MHDPCALAQRDRRRGPTRHGCPVGRFSPTASSTVLQRLSEGAVQADLARTYGVSQATISRLAAPTPFGAEAPSVFRRRRQLVRPHVLYGPRQGDPRDAARDRPCQTLRRLPSRTSHHSLPSWPCLIASQERPPVMRTTPRFGRAPSGSRWPMTALFSSARTETAQSGVSPIAGAHRTFMLNKPPHCGALRRLWPSGRRFRRRPSHQGAFGTHHGRC
jgi:hypothetical protein